MNDQTRTSLLLALMAAMHVVPSLGCKKQEDNASSGQPPVAASPSPAADDPVTSCRKFCAKLDRCTAATPDASASAGRPPAGSWKNAPPEQKAKALAAEIDGLASDAAAALTAACEANCDSSELPSALSSCQAKDCQAFLRCVQSAPLSD